MKIINKIVQEIRNVLYEFFVHIRSIKTSVSHEVPYVCQFATPESAEPSLTRKLSPIDDPAWANTGATSPKEYADWALTMCGMATLRMTLHYFKKETAMKIVPLAVDALRNGVYVKEPTQISNMKYREFAEWIQKFGLRGEVYTRLSFRGIQYALSQGKLVIVSVNPNTRGYKTAPPLQKGGHLVLVTGYDAREGTISINNPSGFVSSHSQVNHTLTINDFSGYYAGRGIVISSNN